ncbi:MAG: glycosyltransferase family 2 protein [Pirellulaceae bacterium]
MIVVSWNASETISACLKALLDQETENDYEVIVVDSGTDGTADLVEERYPGIRLVHCATRKFPGAARNIGLDAAQSDWIGFVDADCIAGTDWINCAVASRASGTSIIGGCIKPANPGNYLGWAPYFIEFSRWMPGMPARAVSDIATCNCVMSRDAIDQAGGFREQGYGSDTALCWSVVAAGLSVAFDPSLAAGHTNITRLSTFLRKQAFHGQHFARMRLEVQGWGIARRLTYAAGSFLLPLLLGARLAGRVFGTARRYRIKFILVSPLVLLGLCLWSAGEMAGYLAPGNTFNRSE